jgi:sec-independent protein translocase protein TatC
MAPQSAYDPDNTRMSLGEHLEELRRRLLYALGGLGLMMALSLVFGRELLALLQAPYRRVLAEKGHEEALLAAFTVTDAFLTYFRVSLLAGLILSSPWVFYQLWLFVAAGLYPRERRWVRWAAPFSALLFVAGAAFFLGYVSRPMLRFFMSFTDWLNLEPVIRLRDLVAFMTNLMLVFGLAFQTPVLVFALGRMGLVTRQTLAKYRRHVIVGMLIVAALLTSPSPIDQVALALPMWLLYELGLLLLRLYPAGDRRHEQSPAG